MTQAKLNAFEEKVLQHWRIKISEQYAANSREYSKVIDKIRNELAARGVLNSGIGQNQLLDAYKSFLRRNLNDFKEITIHVVLKWELKPSSQFQEQIKEEFGRYFDPTTLHHSFREKYGRSRSVPSEAGEFVLRDLNLFANQLPSAFQDIFLEIEAKIPNKSLVFISSAQKEFELERQWLKHLIEKHPILGRFYNVFIFEKDGIPDSASPPEVYLDAVRECAIYIGIFGEELRGPVQAEFEAAREKERFVFFDKTKNPSAELKIFKDDIKNKVSYSEFSNFDDLKGQVFRALEKVIEHQS